jgi:hypothetical protein
MELGILKRLKYGFLAVFLIMVGFNLQSYAEGGSSQAVMSLIVPASDFNMMVKKTPDMQNMSSANRYNNSEQNISVLQKESGVTYRVWVAI